MPCRSDPGASRRAPPPAPAPDFWRPDPAAALPFHVAFESLRTRDQRRHVIAPHRHLHPELLLIEGGRYRCLIEGAELAAGPGALLLAAPGDLHEDRCEAPVRLRCLTMRLLPGPGPGCSAPLLAPGAPPAVRLLGGCAPAAVADAARRIDALRVHGGPFIGPALDAAAQEALSAALGALPPAWLDPRLAGQAARGRFAADLQAVFAAADGPLPAAELARALGLAVRTLSARCRAELGAPPARLYARFRMERARRLLRDSGATVAEVAAALGFASPFHFSAVYKRVHGVPPGQDRG